MVVKPIAFVAIATLVVVGAGTGAYLAVRDNQPPAPISMTPDHSPSPATPLGVTESPIGTGEAVEATEEFITKDTVRDPVTSRGDRTDEGVSVAPSIERDGRPPQAEHSVRNAPSRAASVTPSASDAINLPETTASGETDAPEADRRNSPVDPRPVFETPRLVALRTVDPAALGRAVPLEERPRIVRDLVIAEDSVVGLQVDTPVSTEDAQVEDDVEARVTRDVVVDDEIAIPAGTRVLGSVVLVEGAGELRGAARLGVRFHTIVLDEVFELPIVTETVYREGKGRGSESAAKIGGAAVGGAILGAIFGGRQGAAIGGAAGAAGGTAAAMGGDGQPATLPAGSTLTVRLSRPATVTIEY